MFRLVILVVLLELLVDVGAVVVGILDPTRLTAPGGIVRAIAMGSLAYLFVVKRKLWAQVSFAAVEYVTGLVVLVLAVTAIRAGRVQLDAVIVALVCGYLAAGTIVAFTGRPKRHIPNVGAAPDA